MKRFIIIFINPRSTSAHLKIVRKYFTIKQALSITYECIQETDPTSAEFVKNDLQPMETVVTTRSDTLTTMHHPIANIAEFYLCYMMKQKITNVNNKIWKWRKMRMNK